MGDQFCVTANTGGLRWVAENDRALVKPEAFVPCPEGVGPPVKPIKPKDSYKAEDAGGGQYSGLANRSGLVNFRGGPLFVPREEFRCTMGVDFRQSGVREEIDAALVTKKKEVTKK